MSGSGCNQRFLVDAHFAGRIRPEQEVTLREHLPGCQDCQAYYQRQMVLSGLDPKAPDTKARLAKGLGFRPERKGIPWRLWVPVGAVAAAALALLLVAPWTKAPPESDGFAVRGQAQASIRVYSVAAAGQPAEAPKEIGAGDELAFAYLNPAGKKWLLIFGVDDTGEVYWYHPAWRDPSKNPKSIPIRSADKLTELAEAVSHRLKGESLEIHAIFTDVPLTVREMEEMIRKHPDRIELPDAIQESIRLRIKH